MLRTTLGRLMVDAALPVEHRDLARKLDKPGIAKLLREVAERNPEKYVEVAKSLADIGRRVATMTGGNSFSLSHLSKSKTAAAYKKKVQNELRTILDADFGADGKPMSDEERHERIIKVTGAGQAKQMDDILAESDAEGNPLAEQAISGSRGNKMNLASLRGQDLLYADHRDRTIPVPVLSSYSEGLRPFEYWAGAYGARKGVIDTKQATARAGYMGKILNRLAHRLIVVGNDAEDGDDAGDLRGYPTTTEDGDNEGSLLASAAGPYKRNTPLTAKILEDLRRRRITDILVRSPLVGGPADGGVYARDVGIREKGVLPGIGEPVGFTAAQAVNEPILQAQLSSKHTGGVAGQSKAVGGFQAINQLVEVPASFQGATHATTDGAVSKIEEAPAGGHFISVGGEQHYVPHGVGLKVKVGDDVEAGDSLSEGTANPETVTMYKGHGEGRRSFTNSLVAAFKSAGIRAHRRNVELLARGLIDHVKLTEPVGDNLPDDIVPYTAFANSYQPREDAARKPHRSALGQFLESPVLHYTIGTKVRPSVIKELDRFGVKDVLVHKDPPPFEPVMLRGSTVVSHDPDWQTRMYGSGQKASLLDAAHRGSTSDPAGTSFVPSLAEGTQFGRSTHKVKAPEPGLPLPPEGKPFTDEDDMKHRPKALTISAPAKPTQSFSRLGAMFKFSLDEMASRKEAEEILAKLADAVPQTPMLHPAVPTPQPPRPPQMASAPPLKPLAAAGQHIKSVMPAKPTQPAQPESPPTTIGQTPFGRNPQMAGQLVGGMHQLGQHFGMGDFGALMGIGSMLDPAALGALTRGPDRNSLRPQPQQPQPQPQPQPQLQPPPPPAQPQAAAPPLPAAPDYIPVDQEMWAEGARHGMNAFESMYDWAGRPVLRSMASPEQLFSGNWTLNPFRQTR